MLAGDGAGLLVAIPHDFFQAATDFELPAPGHFAIGQVTPAPLQLLSLGSTRLAIAFFRDPLPEAAARIACVMCPFQPTCLNAH